MDSKGPQRALVIALVANAAFFLVEVIGGLAFRSLALLADAAHMLTDVVALTIALVALRLARRVATSRHSFGFVRAEVIGAQLNGLVLLGVSVWIVVEAVRRVGAGVEVAGGGLLTVAVLGLLVNLGSAALLHREHSDDLNVRGAMLHLVADALGSVGAIGAGVAVLVFDAHWTDPVFSVAIAALVVWSAWKLLRETTHVLLEGAPSGLEIEDVELALRDHPEVDDVHHVHLWALTPSAVNLSAHVVVAEDLRLHEAQELGERLKTLLDHRFGIRHATLELECHVCAPDEPSRAHRG